MNIESSQRSTLLPIPERYRKFLWIVLIYLYFFAFPVSFFHYAVIEPWQYIGMDYPFFYNAGKSLLHGQSPYPQDVIHHEPGADRAWGKYVYPTLYGWIIAPTTVLSQLASKKTYVYTCIFFYFLLFVPWKSASRAGPYERWAALALLCIWGPTIETFRFGQSNTITFFAIFAACCLVERMPATDSKDSPQWREMIAGGLIGLATMIKLTPVVILPVLLVARRWKMAVGYGLGIVLTFLLTGPRTNYEYFTVVLPTMTDFATRTHFMSANRCVIETIDHIIIAGFLPISASRWAPTLGILTNIVLYGWALFKINQNRQTLTRSNAVLIGCYLAPLLGSSWFHHYSLALLPVLFVSRYWIRNLAAKLEGGLKRESWSIRLPGEAKRLLLLLIFLWPDFFFWRPSQAVHIFFYDMFGISDELLVSGTNIVVFLLILPVLLKPSCIPEFAWWRSRASGNSPRQTTFLESYHP